MVALHPRYSKEFENWVYRQVALGATVAEVSRNHGVHANLVYRWCTLCRQQPTRQSPRNREEDTGQSWRYHRSSYCQMGGAGGVADGGKRVARSNGRRCRYHFRETCLKRGEALTDGLVDEYRGRLSLPRIVELSGSCRGSYYRRRTKPSGSARDRM